MGATTSTAKHAVIFDFDGTIVDSLAAVIKVYESVRKGPKLTEREREELQHKSLYRIALDMGLPKWKILYLGLRGRRMFHNHMRSVHVHPGMEEVIKHLYKQGVPLYVLSANRTENVSKYLQWHGLDQYFRGIYGGASFLSKASAMKKLVKQESLNSEYVWCVGDERVDVYSARNANLHSIAVTWGYSHKAGLQSARPDYVVDQSEELLGLLKSLVLQ